MTLYIKSGLGLSLDEIYVQFSREKIVCTADISKIGAELNVCLPFLAFLLSYTVAYTIAKAVLHESYHTSTLLPLSGL